MTFKCYICGATMMLRDSWVGTVEPMCTDCRMKYGNHDQLMSDLSTHGGNVAEERYKKRINDFLDKLKDDPDLMYSL